MTAPRPDVLVDRGWLLAHLEDPDIVILEVDERPMLYRVGHIPGARCLDWHTDLQDPVTRDIPRPEAIHALWRRMGISPDSRVVLYGDKNNWYACFAYWLFRSYGLSKLAILDGGRPAWITNDLPVTTFEPPPAHTAAPTPELAPQFRATWMDVADLTARSGQLLDVRTPEEYRGEMLTEPGYPDEAAQRAGHIPGALNLPWDQVTAHDGTFRSYEDLSSIFTGLGLNPDLRTITYCRIGERSAHTWFVLHELLGWSDVRNYDGSWTEWGSMVAMPVAVGETPGVVPGHWRPGAAPIS
jgi:thiosulfate/3-mercaptopyruvate sulfurtransferase